MNTIKQFKISGKSLNELKKQYGTGKAGFYDQDWYIDEAFANDKPEAGIYEINFGEDTRNKTFGEQQKGLAKGFEVVHPAVIAEALLLHFKESGKYLCENYWVRTSLLDSHGDRVNVGDCDAGGVGVGYDWGDGRLGSIGVGASRKFTPNIETGTLDPLASLESRIAALEVWREKLTNAWNGK